MRSVFQESTVKSYVEIEERFAEKLYDYHYKRLLLQEEWELYSAICYLAGFSAFDDETNFECEMRGMEDAFARVNAFYALAMKSIKKKELTVRGDYSKYPKEQITMCIKLDELSCYVKVWDILKWAVENDIFLPRMLQTQVGLFQENLSACTPEQTYSFFVGGNKLIDLSVSVKDRLTNQAIAQTLCYLEPFKWDHASLAKYIKKDKFLRGLGNASKYVGRNTFGRWLKPVDPRVAPSEKEHRRGRYPKKSNGSNFVPLAEVVYWIDHFYFEHSYMPIYNFKKLKIFVRSCVLTLLHENNSLSLREMIEHPIIQLYVDHTDEPVKKLIGDWITDALKK